MTDLHADDSSGPKLRRVLSATALTALGIGGIIGTGIFVLTGVAAANHAGPALALAFIIAGFGCTLAGLCYAEFAAMIPVSGSAYSYSYATLGEGIAWFIGWNLVLEYLFAVATVSVGWSGYLVSLLDQIGLHLPTAFTSAPFAKGAGDLDIVRTGAIINVPAMAIVAALTVICYIGIRQSSRLQHRHRRHQSDGGAALHRLRCRLHQHRELASVHSGERRSGQVRHAADC